MSSNQHNTLFFFFFFFFFSFFFYFFLATFPSHFVFFISPFSQFSSTNFFQYLSLTLFQILLALTQYPHFNKVTSVSHSSSRIKTHFSTPLWNNYLTIVLIGDSMILIRNQEPVHFSSTHDMQWWWGSICDKNSRWEQQIEKLCTVMIGHRSVFIYM